MLVIHIADVNIMEELSEPITFLTRSPEIILRIDFKQNFLRKLNTEIYLKFIAQNPLFNTAPFQKHFCLLCTESDSNIQSVLNGN